MIHNNILQVNLKQHQLVYPWLILQLFLKRAAIVAVGKQNAIFNNFVEGNPWLLSRVASL